MIDRPALEFMLNDWARFYLSEFNDVNWAKTSMSGKIMEFAELGIMSSGTKCQDNNYEIPEHIESIVKAIAELEIKYQQVIKEQYTGKGNQDKKADRLHLNIALFKVRLFTARKQLMQIM